MTLEQAAEAAVEKKSIYHQLFKLVYIMAKRMEMRQCAYSFKARCDVPHHFKCRDTRCPVYLKLLGQTDEK